MEKYRIPLLAIVFGSVFLSLVKTILFPPPDTNKVVDSTFTPFSFPTAVPLPGWQASTSDSLPNSWEQPAVKPPINNDQLRLLAGRQYRYVQKNLSLDIQMVYVANTSGKLNISTVVKNYSSKQSSFSTPTVLVRHKEGIGFYNLFAYQQRAYLNACINSRGGSTITRSQFMLNRYIYDIRLGRIFSWLLGRESLRDRRCLWAHLSIPLKNSSQDAAYQILEAAWFSWYQWWYPRFPKP